MHVWIGLSEDLCLGFGLGNYIAIGTLRCPDPRREGVSVTWYARCANDMFPARFCIRYRDGRPRAYEAE
jgi:hypothetical protein